MVEETSDLSSESPVSTPKPEGVLKEFPKGKAKNLFLLIAASFLVVLLGVASGWIASGGLKEKTSKNAGKTSGVQGTQLEAGISDEKAFPDSAEGVLEEGGINGEGTHHLVRDGGESQYAYLTSTVIDLDKYKGKKVKVWGETIRAKRAGWFMDVGKIKVIE